MPAEFERNKLPNAQEQEDTGENQQGNDKTSKAFQCVCQNGPTERAECFYPCRVSAVKLPPAHP